MRKEIRFCNYEQLTKWLLTHRLGAEVMRDVLHSPGGEKFYAEFVQRSAEQVEAPTYVVVELHGDGHVRVYGKRHVRATIVQRPLVRSSSLAAAASLVDQLVELDMKQPFREVYWPSYVKASGTLERVSVSKLFERTQKRDFELSVIKGLKA